MAKYEYLYHVEACDRWEPQKKYSSNEWAANKKEIERKYRRTDYIDSCERVRDEHGKLVKRPVEDAD